VAQKQRRVIQQDKAEVNMTPLIDISLVLVVILLLATPLAFESSIGLKKTAKLSLNAYLADHLLSCPSQAKIIPEEPAGSLKYSILSGSYIP